MYGQMGERDLHCTIHECRLGSSVGVVFQVLPRVERELLNVHGKHPREKRERHKRQKHHPWTLCARVVCQRM